MCGLTIAHESPPGTGLELGTPQLNTRCDLIKRGVLASLPPLPRKALAALRANRALSQKATLARLLCAWPPTKTKSQNPTEDALPASLPACLPVPFLRIQNTAKG